MEQTQPLNVTSDLRPVSSLKAAVGVFLGLLGLGVVLQATDPQRLPQVQTFVTVFASLLVEALPFVLLGALVSALIEVFVPVRVFDRLGALPKRLQLPVAGLSGLGFPVCECGSVPVARRLAAKGLSPSAAVTFMLAAPIVKESGTIYPFGREVIVKADSVSTM